MGEVTDAEAAAAVTRDYAEEHCAGTVGDVTDVRRAENAWVVELHTHTFSGTPDHRVRLTRAGNVFDHERVEEA